MRPAAGERPRVLVLVGPTASGKTEVSLQLAGILKGEIISADSRQVYRYLDIGTAKPTPEQRHKVRHHCVDELLPDQEFNAAEFGIRGRRVIEEIVHRRHVPIVVGGSGLYIRSLIDGIFEGPGADSDYRGELEERLRRDGVTPLLQELRAVDPETADRIDPTKPRRVVRALEVHHTTGIPLSRLQKEAAPAIAFEAVQFGLLWDRKELYRRIEQRCEQMLAGGLLDEVEDLERRGFTDRLNALKTVGYAEAFSYRRGEIGYDEMLRLFKQNSRRYAKRQMTWFRKDTRVGWVSVHDPSAIKSVAEEIAHKFAAPAD